MTKSLASKLGFKWDDKSEHWIDNSGIVTLNFDPMMINGRDKICFVHIDNDYFDSIGTLDFSYLEELIFMLKVCNKLDLAERAEALLGNNSLYMD